MKASTIQSTAPAAVLKKESQAKPMLLQFTTVPSSDNELVDFDVSGTDVVLKKLHCNA